MYIPLRGKIFVEAISNLRQTASGLYLADTVKDVPHRGKVIALGKPFMNKKGKDIPWDIKENDIVHFKRNWTGNKDTHYLLLRDDVFAKDGPKAVRDLVIVKRVYEGKIGNSTIQIPDGLGIRSNYESFHGIVVDVGIEDKMGINVGDRLLYHRNEGSEVKLTNGEIYFSLKPRAILARIS